MRNVVLLLLGLAIGAIATANILTALRQRDVYPRGLMNVMQHHLAGLREDLRHNRCGGSTVENLSLLRAISPGIGPAVYAGDTPDAPFREYEKRLQDALAATPATCAELAPVVEKISAACEACHRQYR